MRIFTAFLLATLAFSQAPRSGLREVKRIYVEELKGGPGADSLRELIVASLDSTRLFILTDNPDRADAVLKGAGDDHTYTDAYDSSEGINTRASGGKYGAGTTSTSSRLGGIVGGVGVADNESHHIRERKHEAYATVRICSKDGDVLWSTTQESLGAKFRGASADVAAKIAKQLVFDYQQAIRDPASTTPGR